MQHRAVEHAGLDAVAEPDLVGLRGERLDESVVNGSATRMRFTAMQICPMLENERRAAAAAASATSASSSTTNGHWPPSSSVRRFIVSAAARMIDCPAATEAVAVIMRTSGMGGERRAGFRPRSRQVVEHAGRQARVVETLHDEADGERRFVRRLDDQRAARRERRADLPGVDVDGIVPGRDRADDADRRRDDEAAHVARGRSGASEPPMRRPSSA